MGNHHEIQLLQINAQRLHVMGEDFRIVARVKQNPLPAVFNQSRVTPVLGQVRRTGLAERVIQNGDAIGGLGEAKGCNEDKASEEGEDATHAALLLTSTVSISRPRDGNTFYYKLL